MTAQTPTARALVMVPGLMCDEDLFAAQRDALVGEGVRVVVPDLSQAGSMTQMADAVLAVAPERFCLLGLSMGGYVAFEVMRRQPHRVRGLALLDTSARPDSAEQTARRRALLQAARTDGLDAAFDALWPFEVSPARVPDAALRARFDAMGHRLGFDAFTRQQEAVIARPDSRPALSDIAVPTLVLCGREDAITPVAVHEEMAAAVPGARLVVLPECGHLSTWEQPEAVTAELRTWLQLAGC